MPKPISIVSLVLTLMVSSVTLAQNQRFIPVEGSNLKSKLEAAIKLGRARSPQTPYWTAYAFDVRPGAAVDAGVACERRRMARTRASSSRGLKGLGR
jgi:hypothetical protein